MTATLHRQPPSAVRLPQRQYSRRWLPYSVALLITANTKLRFDLPIGPGELLLIGLSLKALLSKHWSPQTEITRPFMFFWAPFLVVGLLSSFLAVLLGRALPYMWTDIVSYAFVVVFVVALVGRKDLWAICNVISRYFAAMASTLSFLLYLVSRVMPTIGPFALLDGDYATYGRFQGLTTNANQMALIGTLSFVLSMFNYERTRRAIWLAFAFMGLACGVVSISDGFRVSLAVAVAVTVARAVWAPARTPGGAVLRMMVAIAVALIMAFVVSAATGYTEYLASKDNGQATERVELWSRCIHRIETSPVIGNGLGAQATKDGVGQECHNTFLEVFSATGFLGILGLLTMMVIAARYAMRYSVALTGGLVMITIQSSFSHFLRHIEFWLVLIIVIAYGTSRRQAARRSGASTVTLARPLEG